MELLGHVWFGRYPCGTEETNTEKRDCETQVFLKGTLDIFCSTSRSIHKYSLILDRNFFEESERDKNIVCTYKATVVDGTVGIRDNEW